MTRRSMLVTLGAAGATAAGASVLLSRPQSSTPTRGPGQWTSFGTVVLLGWSRLALAGSASHEQGHQQERAASDTPVPSAVHGAWTDAVMVDVQVHNGSQGPIELSPGQFRVRVDDGGPTVSLYRSDRPAGRLEAGSTTNLRISYLAPPPGAALSLEFADAISARTHRLGPLDARSDA